MRKENVLFQEKQTQNIFVEIISLLLLIIIINKHIIVKLRVKNELLF